MLKSRSFDVETRSERHGVTALELRNLELMSAATHERWMLDECFAEPNGEPHRLVPAALAFEVAGDLPWSLLR